MAPPGAVQRGAGDRLGVMRTADRRSTRVSHPSQTGVSRDGECGSGRLPRGSVCVLCHFNCVQLCHPVDHSPAGSSVHGDSPGKNTGVGNHTLLQGIFLTQGSIPRLLHCRQILYHLSHNGSPLYPFREIHSFIHLKHLSTYCLPRIALGVENSQMTRILSSRGSKCRKGM